MTRYVKQTDNFRCGPIVIFNVLKWAGCEISWTDTKNHITKLCKAKSYYGTYIPIFNKVLRSEGKKYFSIVKRRKTISTLIIDKHLDDGGAIIFAMSSRGYSDGYSRNHLSLCIGKFYNYYHFVNAYEGHTTSWVTRKELITCLRTLKQYRHAWFLKLW